MLSPLLLLENKLVDNLSSVLALICFASSCFRAKAVFITMCPVLFKARFLIKGSNKLVLLLFLLLFVVTSVLQPPVFELFAIECVFL